jgi:signal transduction histidine kinase
MCGARDDAECVAMRNGRWTMTDTSWQGRHAEFVQMPASDQQRIHERRTIGPEPMCVNSEVVYVCVDEARYNQLLTDLEASRRINARQSLAMATAGHDLRQHLQNVLLVLDLVRRAPTRRRDSEWLATAEEQVACITRGLEGLAREANVRAWNVEPERSSFPIAPLLARIERKWSVAADARKLRLTIDRSDARVRSNAAMLFAVIDNLVGNAIRHTSRGGVDVDLCTEGSELLVSIQDTGPGIGSENMEVIFEPYWRGPDSDVGMGLGLAIVRTTATLLNHPISVSSLVGRGTCFTVHVPLATATVEGGIRFVDGLAQ